MSAETEPVPPLEKLAQGSYDDIRQKTGLQDLLYIVAYGVNSDLDPVVLMVPSACEEQIVCGKRKAKQAVDSGICEAGIEPQSMATRTCRWVNVGGTLRWICS